MDSTDHQCPDGRKPFLVSGDAPDGTVRTRCDTCGEWLGPATAAVPEPGGRAANDFCCRKPQRGVVVYDVGKFNLAYPENPPAVAVVLEL